MVLALRGGSRRKFSLFGTSTRNAQEEVTVRAKRSAAARLHAHAGAQVRELSYGEQRQLELALAIVCLPTGPARRTGRRALAGGTPHRRATSFARCPAPSPSF